MASKPTRLIFVEPNPCDNKLLPNEDLSIIVELRTISRGRSVIVSDSDNPVQNTQDKETDFISFIDGSNVGMDRKSLTTNYTQLREIGVKGDNDLESLGIENIIIEFDTAYTPLIKIKFIDVRGKAILEPGTDSKYSMFFELPYPIFKLTVKGFYGKPVTYCLHLTKWNASFNSSTGNFEIDADFIGYTYAMLTDCLMGLMRATALTDIGSAIFKKYQEEDIRKDGIIIRKKYPDLETIPQFLKSVAKVSSKFGKLKEKSENIKQINALNKITDELKYLNKELNNLIKDSASGSIFSPSATASSRFIYVNGTFDTATSTSAAKPNFKTRVANFRNKINERLISKDSVNRKIEVESLKIKPSDKNQIDPTTNLPLNGGVTFVKRYYFNLKQGETPQILTNQLLNGGGKFNAPDVKKIVDSIPMVLDPLTKIRTTKFTGDAYLYDLTKAYEEIDRVEDEVKKLRAKLELALEEELKQASNDSGTAKFTIGNVITMLSIHAQVFFETIQAVSKKALGNEKREVRYKTLIGLAGLNKNNGSGVPVTTGDGKDVPDTIFPWPEYKKRGSADDNQGYYESWIGKELVGLEFQNVPEIEFVEELLEKLMNVAKNDEKRELAAMGIKTVQFYPVTPLDAPISYNDGLGGSTNGDTLIKQNPYHTALLGPNTMCTPDEATRLLIMRGFIGLTLSNVAPEEGQIITMGRLEAENLFNVILSEFDRERTRNMLRDIRKFSTPEELIKPWNGKNNPNAKGPKNQVLISSVKAGTHAGKAIPEAWRYDYVRVSSETIGQPYQAAYIPISGGFDCLDFYTDASGASIRSLNSLKKDVAPKLLYISNQTGHIHTLDGGQRLNGYRKGLSLNPPDKINLDRAGLTYRGEAIDDGSIYLKIMNESDFTNQGKTEPQFGDELSKFKKDIGVESNNNPNNILAIDRAKKTYKNMFIAAPNGEETISVKGGLDWYNGRFKTLQIDNINYAPGDAGNLDTPFARVSGAGDISSVICSYWGQLKLVSSGTHLALVDEGIKKSIHNMTSKDIFSKKKNAAKDNEEFIVEKMRVQPQKVVQTLQKPPNTNVGDKYGKNRELIMLPRESLAVPRIEFTYETEEDAIFKMSLFGSKFYYQQHLLDGSEAEKIAKAFLFLHTFSFNGCIGDLMDAAEGSGPGGYATDNKNIAASLFDRFNAVNESFKDEDETPMLKFMFQNSASFIKAPKLWCAFLGGLLLRYNTFKTDGKDIIYIDNEMFPTQTKEDSYMPPDMARRYLYNIETVAVNSKAYTFGGLVMSGQDKDDRGDYYPIIDRGLTSLPAQAKNEFIRIFKEFALGEDFKTIRDSYELFSDSDDLSKKTDALMKKKKKAEVALNTLPVASYIATSSSVGNPTTEVETLTYSDIKSVFKGNHYDGLPFITDDRDGKVDVCYNISPTWVSTTGQKVAQMNITYREDSEANKLIVKLMKEEVRIVNAQPRAFTYSPPANADANATKDGTKQKPYKEDTDKLGGYLDEPYRDIEVNKDLFSIYLNSFINKFKELSDEWDNDSDRANDNIQQKLFNAIDDDVIKLNIYRTLSSINNKWIGGESYGGCSDIRSIAESFKFLDSGFGDISDQFFINPELVQEKILGNYNQSFFDVVNKTLSDNKFNFIPLPAFIDFTNKQQLEDAFKAYPYKQAIKTGAVKPSFVCVYAGQTSNNLDLGKNTTTHKDDGIYIKSDCEGNFDYEDIPTSFDDDDNPKSTSVPYFAVSYARNNQSFFKDIRLDQREFTETAESLRIIEDITQNSGDKRKASFKGQNLFNIYQTRSYSAEVEMMGNAMVQPMMYFQLNNIPMFRGAYLIIKTSHNITAHNMTTKFKGVRVKKTKTPLIKEGEFFMNLLGDFSNVGEAEKITDVTANSSITGGGTNGSSGSSSGTNKAVVRNNNSGAPNPSNPSSTTTSTKTNSGTTNRKKIIIY